MANAGRVALVPKGEYSSSAVYKRLDYVRSGNKTYVAKKDTPASTSVENTEYWMLCTDNTVTITDADTLGGHSASDFLQVSSNQATGKLIANATAVAALGDKQVRNIYAGTTDMVAGESTLATGDIYIYYE